MLLSFNVFLNTIDFDKIDENVLTSIIHTVISPTVKNGIGLFVTPPKLAHLLVDLALRDTTGHSIDPFCGTGTILRAILSLKENNGIPEATALETSWGSDKFSLPIQVSSMSLFSPRTIGRIIKLFTFDALNLKVNKDIEFINPISGEPFSEKLPVFSSIISNLPFINFEQIEELNQLVWNRMEEFYKKYAIPKEYRLSQRSDFYAYIPFVLYDLIVNEGTIGFIVSNSWLSTDWGVNFKKLLRLFYDIDYVITSAKGRWFKNAKVVTTILICAKKTVVSNTANHNTLFVSTNKSLESRSFNSKEIATSILSKDYANDDITMRCWDDRILDIVDSLGIGWIPLFSDLSWFLDNKELFVPLRTVCKVTRGERRGWDEMFILSIEDSAKIDQKFLAPHLKNINGHYHLLIDQPDSYAFVCNLSEQELKSKENITAYKWIHRFAGRLNTSGKPLKESLRIPNGQWYQFKVKAYADYIMPMNPDTRLYAVSSLKKMVLNQRLICLSLIQASSEDEKSLIHALLNSSISMLMTEMLGFGRGESVLDITPSKIESGFWLPNPSLFDVNARMRIIEAFKPLLKRKILAVSDELLQEDRKALDKAILSTLGMDASKYLPIIYNSLLTLYNIRKSVLTIPTELMQ